MRRKIDENYIIQQKKVLHGDSREALENLEKITKKISKIGKKIFKC